MCYNRIKYAIVVGEFTMNYNLLFKIILISNVLTSAISHFFSREGVSPAVSFLLCFLVVFIPMMTVAFILIRISKKHMSRIYGQIADEGGEIFFFEDASPAEIMSNGGHLLLTDEGLEYYPNLLHIDRTPVMIRFEDIIEMSHGFQYILVTSVKDNEGMKFKVSSAVKWCELTAQTMAKYGLDQSVVRL